MLGFTYNGVHSGTMKVRYAPGADDRGNFFPDPDVGDSERSWKDGGILTNIRMKTRSFTIDCFYEYLTDRELNSILRWLHPRSSGTLVFDERPWASYYVHHGKKPVFKDYCAYIGDRKLHSGTIVLTMECSSPFAQLLYTTKDTAPQRAEDELDLLTSDMMPAYDGTSLALVYNPGTEQGHSRITFSGNSGSGITITNTTTGDVCKIREELPQEEDTVYIIDSRTGRCYWKKNDNETVDFVWHDAGYITFAPNKILLDDIGAKTTLGSRTVEVGTMNASALVGAYIWMDGKWNRITGSETPDTVEVQTPAVRSALFRTTIVTMNTLTVTFDNDVSISNLTIQCLPEVR